MIHEDIMIVFDVLMSWWMFKHWIKLSGVSIDFNWINSQSGRFDFCFLFDVETETRQHKFNKAFQVVKTQAGNFKCKFGTIYGDYFQLKTILQNTSRRSWIRSLTINSFPPLRQLNNQYFPYSLPRMSYESITVIICCYKSWSVWKS